MITWVSALTQASYESHLAGLQKMDGSWPHDKMWPPGEGNGNPLQYSCLVNSMNTIKRQKDMTPEDEPQRSAGV